MLIPFLIDKCDIEPASASAPYLPIAGGFTYSSPAFGGCQSPCPATRVAENALLEGKEFDNCEFWRCFGVALRRFAVLGVFENALERVA
jgi:hypothetical protein